MPVLGLPIMKVFHGDEVSFRCFPKFLPKILSNFHLSLCKSLVCCFPPSFEPLWNPLFVFVVVCVWKYCGFSLGPCPFLSLSEWCKRCPPQRAALQGQCQVGREPFSLERWFCKITSDCCSCTKGGWSQLLQTVYLWHNSLKKCPEVMHVFKQSALGFSMK